MGEPETIMFGKGYREVVRPNADWGRAATTKHVLTAVNLTNPRVVKLKDDRTETYLKELRGIIDPSVQLVVTIFPQLKSDGYSAIKKLCCVEMPVASQVVIAKTIMNEKRLHLLLKKSFCKLIAS